MFILIIPQTKACFGECEVIKLTQVILHRNVSFQNELSMIVPLPVQGEIISVCVMCLKYRTGYVIIIYQPHMSRTEGINSRCERFGLLLFCRFGSISQRFERNCRRSGCPGGGCRRFDVSLAINY